MKTGIERIAAERQRQIDEKSRTPERDDLNTLGQLAGAGACYALMACNPSADHIRLAMSAASIDFWPWHQHYRERSEDPIRNLEKAGALIAAEIDRLQRLNSREK